MYDWWMVRFLQFIKTAGGIGGGSVILAIACFAITVEEHLSNRNVPAAVFGFLTVGFFCFGAFQAWNKEREARVELERRYFDERPELVLEIISPQGPAAWRERATRDICWFWMQQLSGRAAKSVRFDSIPSINGRFALDFDAVSFVERSPRRTALIYHIQEVGCPTLSGHDLDEIGDIEGQLLGMFLDDSPPELISLNYRLIVRFKDREDEERTKTFRLVFDKHRFAFLPNTEESEAR